jgi:hypothetical protein
MKKHECRGTTVAHSADRGKVITHALTPSLRLASNIGHFCTSLRNDGLSASDGSPISIGLLKDKQETSTDQPAVTVLRST